AVESRDHRGDGIPGRCRQRLVGDDLPARADRFESPDAHATPGYCGAAATAASSLILTIAWSKPALVSDGPATRSTCRSSSLRPTTTSAMPAMNWPWYRVVSGVSGSPVTSTSVTASSLRVIVTEIVSTVSGVLYAPSAV